MGFLFNEKWKAGIESTVDKLVASVTDPEKYDLVRIHKACIEFLAAYATRYDDEGE